ncbi:MAG: ADP-ribosylglycohydrolase family protein, partial [Sulfurovaceae bacterium]|nr:ADP-ribosylglycohydrolase family protein [Sulfurovaceae bacterium]
MEIKNRYKGSMLGLAIGDALGAPVEFTKKDSFEKIVHYRRGGKFNVAIGEYTDDTAMALCLAQSLIDKNGIDQKDQLSKYLKWFEEGYMSANGRSIGCGKVTLRALYRYMSKDCSECGNSRLTKGAGNGSLMRIAPVALFYAHDKKLAMEMAKKSSLTTHGLPICSDASMYMGGLIIGAIEG